MLKSPKSVASAENSATIGVIAATSAAPLSPVGRSATSVAASRLNAPKSAYNAAVAGRKAPSMTTLASLVVHYKSKPEYLSLADSTRKEWSRWLDRISLHDIGTLTYRALDDRRVRSDLIDWRDEYADRPRTADYGMQVLSRVLGFAFDRGLLRANHASGVAQLYHSNRADQIWTPAELAAFAAVASAPVSTALRLACLTGLRRGDLIALTWGQIGDLVIEKATNKSGQARVAVVPLLDEARHLLEQVGRRGAADTVLLNSRGRKWSAAGLTHQIVDANAKAGIGKTLHDARGTFATRLRLAGVTRDEIADIMGWKKDRVDRILTRYVEQDAVITAMMERIRENETATKTPK